MSSSAIEAGTEGLTVRATLPDAKTATSWASELSLSADRLRYAEAEADGGKAHRLPRPVAHGPAPPLLSDHDRERLARRQAPDRGSPACPGLLGRFVSRVRRPERRSGRSPDRGLRGLLQGRRAESGVEGEEVSQTLVRDSFEAYEPATFPRQGGWRAASTEAIEPGQEVIPTEAQRGKDKQGTVSVDLRRKQAGTEGISK